MDGGRALLQQIRTGQDCSLVRPSHRSFSFINYIRVANYVEVVENLSGHEPEPEPEVPAPPPPPPAPPAPPAPPPPPVVVATPAAPPAPVAPEPEPAADEGSTAIALYEYVILPTRFLTLTNWFFFPTL